jgi:pimeloyl-ACP methyl ester carboxylesterase
MTTQVNDSRAQARTLRDEVPFAEAPDAEWNEPQGIGPRGTIILAVGRGESGRVYDRFGARIASDAYRVRTVADASADPEGARRRIAGLLADDSLPAPKVLLGSDAGAALVLELAAEGTPADAFIVAGLPTAGHDATSGGESAGDWQDELDARTACPNHRGVLARVARAGAIWEPLPAQLLTVVASAIRAPVLAIHGDADTLSQVDSALGIYRALPIHEIAVVSGGRHDILNDVTHRSVAATIVLFLERLRLGGDRAPIVESR